MSIAKKVSTLCSFIVFIPALASAGTLKSMDKDEVTTTFKDKTITTISAATLNNEVISDSFSGYFANDGKMLGKFASQPKDQPQDDTGTWNVNSEGKLCYKWDHWNSGKDKCAAIYKLSNGLLVINDQNGFESFILSANLKSGNQVPK
jgi:hypothetical protein